MEGLGSFLLFAAVFYFMMRVCGSHMSHGHGGHGHSKEGASTENEAIQKYVDPVCDMEVEPEQGYGKMYEGTLYRFCTKSCLDKFDDEPERYINKRLTMIEEKHDEY